MSTTRGSTVAARFRRVLVRRRARRHRYGIPAGSAPRRFGEAYRWPDGTWTQSG
ncbi:MAG: hypothetical protein AB7J32_03505 [Pseudonocardia sp.]